MSSEFQLKDPNRKIEELRKKISERDKKARMHPIKSTRKIESKPNIQSVYSVKSPMKKQRRHLRPTEELFYSPRKTSRQQKISDLSECLECVCQEGPESSNYFERCPRCGVAVPVPQPSSTSFVFSKSSQDFLSEGSIEACAKNEWLLNTTKDICVRCGYVHPSTKYCPQLPLSPLRTKPLQQIKEALGDQVEMPKWPAYCSPAGILKNSSARFRVVDP